MTLTVKLAKLTSKVSMVQPRLGVQGHGNRPWQKNELSAARQLSGQQRKKRNDRIKLRDGYACKACGRITNHLEIDHIVPLSEGGTEDDANLQSLCAGEDGCHALKSKAERARYIDGSRNA